MKFKKTRITLIDGAPIIICGVNRCLLSKIGAKKLGNVIPVDEVPIDE